jgi:DNA polymerase I
MSVVLIDAHNWLHRFHHAMPPQIHRGRNVAAVRALRDLAQRMMRQLRPSHVVAVFDAGDAGRSRMFAGYKAGRSETPAELQYQIDVARDHLPRFGTPTIRVDGYEADDVIASVAARLRVAGTAVHVVSGDKDLCALVVDADPSVTVHAKRGEGWEQVHETDVRGRFGVPPCLVLDLLALAGDDSDGIPGLPGIGPKTGAELLNTYGDLEVLLRSAPLLSRERLRLLLQEHADAARLYRRVLEFAAVPIEEIEASTWVPK